MDGLSLAALAEAVISVRSVGRGLQETVDLLRRMSRGRTSSREGCSGGRVQGGRGRLSREPAAGPPGPESSFARSASNAHS